MTGFERVGDDPVSRLPTDWTKSMSASVRAYYNRNARQEWERLDLPLGRIEFSSTMHLIEKYFPARGRVCDIGGGPGRYTMELIRRGYQVTLLDLSEDEVLLAHVRLNELGLSAERLITGDARDLSAFASRSFDAALLLGPMYHILDSGQRDRALRELARILKPRGVAIIAYLNSWGIMKTGISDFPSWYEDISVLRSMPEEHVYPEQKLTEFTDAYWSTPPAAQDEIKRNGLELISYAGAEGFVGGMQPLVAQLAIDRPNAYMNVMQVAAETCELPQFRDATDHLHLVVRNPDADS